MLSSKSEAFDAAFGWIRIELDISSSFQSHNFIKNKSADVNCQEVEAQFVVGWQAKNTICGIEV